MIERYVPFFEDLLVEAIIKPEKYFDPIKEKCKIFPKLFTKDKGLNHTCAKLSILLQKYKIKFISESKIDNYEFLANYGFNKGGTLSDKHGTIILYCNTNLLKIFDGDSGYRDFEKAFFTILKHELIHRIQYINISNKIIRQRVDDAKDPYNHIKYLNDKQEIMAYAWQMIEYYRLMGANKDEIIMMLKKPRELYKFENNILSSYIRANESKVVTDESLKLLYKYVYLYATEK